MARALLTAARAKGLTLVTTEKDLARIAGDPALTSLAAEVQALPVRLKLTQADELRRLMLARLGIATPSSPAPRASLQDRA
jgi:tetraacyldisaccharide 4'-kinase